MTNPIQIARTLLSLLASMLFFNQALSAQEWMRSIGTLGNDVRINSTDNFANGDYIVAGHGTVPGRNNTDLYLSRITSAGAIVWQQYYELAQNEVFPKVFVDAQDSVVVNVVSQGASVCGVFMKINPANGNIVWRNNLFNNGLGLGMTAFSILENGGNYLFAGTFPNATYTSFNGSFLISLDRNTGAYVTGSGRTTSQFSGAYAALENGILLVSGGIPGGGTGIFQINPATMGTIRYTSFQHNLSADSWGYDAHFLPNGQIITHGISRTYNDNTRNHVIYRFNRNAATGNLTLANLWELDNALGFDAFNSMLVRNDNSILLNGSTGNFTGGNLDMAFLDFNPSTGTFNAQRRYGQANNDVCIDMAFNGSEMLLVGGTTSYPLPGETPTTNGNFYLIRSNYPAANIGCPANYTVTNRNANLTILNNLNTALTNFVPDARNAATIAVVPLNMVERNICPFCTGVNTTVQVTSNYGNTGCLGLPLTITANGGGGQQQYAWSFNGQPVNGNNTNTIQIPVLQAANAGLYSVTVTDLNASCSAIGTFTLGTQVCPEVCNDGLDNDQDGLTDCADIIDCPSPNISIQGVMAYYCVSNSFAILAVGGGAGTTYQWSGPNINTPTTNAGLVFNNVQLNQAGLYTVVATNANGCTDNASANIIVNYTGATISTAPEDCNQNNGQIVASNFIGEPYYTLNLTGPNNYSNFQVTYDSQYVFTGLAAGNYNLNIMDSLGCVADIPVTVTAGNGGPGGGCPEICADGIDNDGDGLIDCADSTDCPPTFVNIENFSNNPYCVGSEVVMDASGIDPNAVYSWSGPGLPVPYIGSNITITNVQLANAGIYTVSTTGANGCLGTYAVTLTVVDASLNLSATPDSCGDGVATLTIGINDGSPFFFVEAYGPNGYANTDFYQASPVVLNSLSAGTYTVMLADANGCTDTASIVITPTVCVEICNDGLDNEGDGLIDCADATDCPAPALNIENFSNNPYCVGSEVVMDASGIDPNAVYSWSGPGLPVPYIGSNITINNVQLANAGIYTVSTTGANGCSSTASVNLVVVNLTVNLIPRTDTCNAGVGRLVVSATVGQPDYFISISGPNNYANTLFSSTAMTSISNLQAGTYSVQVTDANGCTFTGTVAVGNVQICPEICNDGIDNDIDGLIDCADAVDCPAPSLVIENFTNMPYCVNSEVILDATTGNPNDVYAWSGPGLQVPYLGSNITIDNVQLGNAGIYTVTATSTNGCIATASISLQVVDVQFSLQILDGQCGGPGRVQVTFQGTPQFAVNFESNNFSGTYFTNNFVDVFGTFPADPYTIMVMDANGCVSTQFVTIATTAAVTAQLPATLPATCQQAAQISPIVSGTGPIQYQWSNGATTSSISTTQAGIYNVTVSDINGCSASATVEVTGGCACPPVQVELCGPSYVCAGGSLTLRPTFTPAIPLGGVTYLWTGPNGFTSMATTITLSGLTPAQNGDLYTLTIQYSNGLCSVTAAYTVVVNPVPVVAATHNGPLLHGCTAVFTATPGYEHYQWAQSGGALNTGTGSPFVVPNVDANDRGTYSVTATDDWGCTARALTSIRLYPVTATATPTFVPGNNTQVTLRAAPNNFTFPTATYSWSGPNGYTGSGSQVVRQGIGTTLVGIYTVTVTLANGCTGTASVQVSQGPTPLREAADFEPIFESAPQIKAVPNPADDFVYFDVLDLDPSTITTISVLSTDGRNVSNYTQEGWQGFHVADWSAGLYHVVFHLQDGKTVTTTFMKN